MHQKLNSKELAAFRRGEMAKAKAIITAIEKADNDTDIKALSQSLAAIAVKIETAASGKVHSSWLENDKTEETQSTGK